MAFHNSFQHEKKLKIDGVIKNLRGADFKKKHPVYTYNYANINTIIKHLEMQIYMQQYNENTSEDLFSTWSESGEIGSSATVSL